MKNLANRNDTINYENAEFIVIKKACVCNFAMRSRSLLI